MTAPTIDWEALERAARTVRGCAYAPYSRFLVGAAIQANGRVFIGCNVENASYPVGLCAERAALAAAIAAGCQDLEAAVIAAERPLTPCGMCRQALAEFNPELPIRAISDDAAVDTSLARLFPDPFALD